MRRQPFPASRRRQVAGAAGRGQPVEGGRVGVGGTAVGVGRTVTTRSTTGPTRPLFEVVMRYRAVRSGWSVNAPSSGRPAACPSTSPEMATESALLTRQVILTCWPRLIVSGTTSKASTTGRGISVGAAVTVGSGVAVGVAVGTAVNVATETLTAVST